MKKTCEELPFDPHHTIRSFQETRRQYNTSNTSSNQNQSSMFYEGPLGHFRSRDPHPLRAEAPARESERWGDGLFPALLVMAYYWHTCSYRAPPPTSSHAHAAYSLAASPPSNQPRARALSLITTGRHRRGRRTSRPRTRGSGRSPITSAPRSSAVSSHESGSPSTMPIHAAASGMSAAQPVKVTLTCGNEAGGTG